MAFRGFLDEMGGVKHDEHIKRGYKKAKEISLTYNENKAYTTSGYCNAENQRNYFRLLAIRMAK